MTRFDHDALIAKRNIMQMCVHMSAAYIAPILDDAELMLVSRHQTQNAVTRRIVEILTPMASGAAFQVIREVRAALLPVYQSRSLTLRSGRDATYIGFDEGIEAEAMREVSIPTCDEMRNWFASYGDA